MKSVFIECFGENQHAFRPQGSTVSALVDIHNFITLSLENPSTTDVRVTCLDFSKAFDKLHHNRLINHLNALNLNHGFLRWLTSYLCCRSQRISLEGRTGPLMNVPSGVPQGSVLGPYLFALFISTLRVDSPGTKLVKYADDLTLIEVLSSHKPDPAGFHAIDSWIQENKMTLNPRKCQHLMIQRSRQQNSAPNAIFQIQPSVTLLGVTLDNKLKWDSHFKRVILVATRRLHIIRMLKPYLSKQKLLHVFQAIVLSVILYASPVFGEFPASTSQKVQSLCKRAHRIICDYHCTCSIIPDITRIRENLACKFLLSCEHPTHPLHSQVPQRLPTTGKFRQPYSSTSRRSNSFFPYACALVNNIAALT